MTVDEFVEAYDYLSEHASDTWEIDKIFSRYDPDGNLNIYQLFDEMSEEDKYSVFEYIQDKMNELQNSMMHEGDVGYAEKLYNSAISHDIDASSDYCQGIIDFYEALVDEGYIEEFGE